MSTRRQHYVRFHSPGTFVDEESERPISSWDIALAVEMASTIKERYDARPYGFVFLTKIVSNPVPDGEGGSLDVLPATVAESGMHYLGGALLTLEQIKARNNPRDNILIGNMECNHWSVVVENTNSFRTVRPFRSGDVLLDGAGNVVVKA